MLKDTLTVDRETVETFDNIFFHHDEPNNAFFDIFEEGEDAGDHDEREIGNKTFADGVYVVLVACTRDCSVWCEVRWYDKHNNFFGKDTKTEMLGEYNGYTEEGDTPTHVLTVEKGN